MFPDYSKNCTLHELGIGNFHYLKFGCHYDEHMWYRCPNSDKFYGVQRNYIRPGNVCHRIRLDIACPGDTHFYQVCGHDGCSGYAVCIILFFILFFLIPSFILVIHNFIMNQADIESGPYSNCNKISKSSGSAEWRSSEFFFLSTSISEFPGSQCCPAFG